MSDTQERLDEMLRFRVGEHVNLHGITFRIDRVSDGHLMLTKTTAESEQWRAFGQGMVDSLRQSGILNQDTRAK